MSKLLTAMIAAGLSFSVTSAIGQTIPSNDTHVRHVPTLAQQDTNAPEAARKNRDSTQQGEVTPGPGAGKHDGTTESNSNPQTNATSQTGNDKDPDASSNGEHRRNRDSTQQGPDVVPGPGAGQHTGSNNNEPVKTGEPATSGNAGDPTEALKNRESSKQQGNPETALPKQ
ncbi:MAG: hypothetical protein ABI612_14955 [Betaproteobacteria bacterium]